MKNLVLDIGLGVVAMLLIAIIGLIAAVPVMILWNWLMPIVFKLTTITYFQAWGLFFLARLLIRGSSSRS